MIRMFGILCILILIPMFFYSFESQARRLNPILFEPELKLEGRYYVTFEFEPVSLSHHIRNVLLTFRIQEIISSNDLTVHTNILHDS